MAWLYRRYGSASDPIHKSDLNGITGDYGCDRQFRYYRDAAADGQDESQTERVVSGRAAAGNAVHETIARALSNPEMCGRVLAGPAEVSRKRIADVFAEELQREAAGREIAWYRDKADKVCNDRVSMVVGLLSRLHAYVAEILLVEGGFIVPFNGYWLSGHIDLLYRPRQNPTGLAIADWKSGAQKPHGIELEHGWEAGIYSLAVRAGHFLARDCLTDTLTSPDLRVWDHPDLAVQGLAGSHLSARRKALEAVLIERALSAEAGIPIVPTFGEFPEQIWHVHLGDYVPYQKAGSKEVKRPEDVRHYGLPTGTKLKYWAGDLRGPAWLPVRRTEEDIPRLAYQLRQVVGTVRMGRFAERRGEKCMRCAFAEPCLSTGYAPRGEEQRETERRLRVLDDAELSDGL
jgi:hypothetical protein